MDKEMMLIYNSINSDNSILKAVKLNDGEKNTWGIELIIPDDVKVIESRACWNKKIDSVHFPAGLEFIGQGAFMYCADLMSVQLPDKIKNIEADTFYMCKSLEHVELSSNLIFIGSKAFLGCHCLKKN